MMTAFGVAVCMTSLSPSPPIVAQYVQSLESRLKEAAGKNGALMKENQLLREKISQLLEEVRVNI